MKPGDIKWIKGLIHFIGLKKGTDYVVYPCKSGKTQIEISNDAWLELFFGEFAYLYEHGPVHAQALRLSARAESLYAAAREAAGIFDETGEWPNSAKWIPYWAFQLGRAECEAVLRGLFRADGRSPESKRMKEQVASAERLGTDETGANVVYTSSVYFRDQLLRFAVHAARSCYFTLAAKAGTKSKFKGGQVAVKQHDAFEVHMSVPSTGKGRTTPVVGAEHFERVRKQPAMYQVMTESGLPCIARQAALVRDKGATSNRAFVLCQPASQTPVRRQRDE
jgi:hypothetical protein